MQVHRQLVEPLVTGGGPGQVAGQLRAKTGLQRSVLRYCHRAELRQGSLVVGNAHPNGDRRQCRRRQQHAPQQNKNEQAAKRLHRSAPYALLPQSSFGYSSTDRPIPAAAIRPSNALWN